MKGAEARLSQSGKPCSKAPPADTLTEQEQRAGEGAANQRVTEDFYIEMDENGAAISRPIQYCSKAEAFPEGA